MVELNAWFAHAAIFLLIIASIIAIASLIRFSSILIKLVVLELLTNLLMAGIALWALINHQPVFIDICLTLALIMFLGVVAYYQFLFRKENENANNHR